MKGIKNYKKYIDNMFIEREIERDMIKVRNNDDDKKVDNDFKKWGYTNCLRCLCEGNYCKNHDKLYIYCVRIRGQIICHISFVIKI